MSLSNRSPGSGIISLAAQSVLADGAAVIMGTADDTFRAPAATAADALVLGLLKHEGSSCAVGEGCDIVLDGVYSGIAGGTITRKDMLVVGGVTGTLVTATVGLGSLPIVGMALESASSGERVAVLISRQAGGFQNVAACLAVGAITANTAVQVATTAAVGAAPKVKTATTGDTATMMIGIALNTAADGGTVYVALAGSLATCITQGNVTVGQNLAVGDTAGAVKPAAGTAGTLVRVVGVAFTTATAPAPVSMVVQPFTLQIAD
jgi:hypothetical protein